MVIGRPKSGKTTFFVQFYIRIVKKQSTISLWKTPPNIRAIEDAVKRLTNGEEVQTTPADSNEALILPIRVDDTNLELVCPDYGGEQVNSLVNLMEYDEHWHRRVGASNRWILFIRPSGIINYYDLSNAGYAQLQKKKSEGQLSSPLSEQIQLIELLQGLLYIKGRGLKTSFADPGLSVALTCWDELSTKAPPGEYLQTALPLLHEFLVSNWGPRALKIFGLSSQEFPLKDPAAKERYLEELPQNFGYLVMPDGEKTKDITFLVKETIQ